MLNPDTLVDALVAKLKLISGFMALMGNDANNVRAHIDNESSGVLDAINTMEFPSCLVVWQELEDVPEGQAQWTHRVSLYIRANARIGAILYAVTDGIPTGSTYPLSSPDTTHSSWELLGIPTAVRAVDENDVEFLEVTLRYREKGWG